MNLPYKRLVPARTHPSAANKEPIIQHENPTDRNPPAPQFSFPHRACSTTPRPGSLRALSGHIQYNIHIYQYMIYIYSMFAGFWRQEGVGAGRWWRCGVRGWLGKACPPPLPAVRSLCPEGLSVCTLRSRRRLVACCRCGVGEGFLWRWRFRGRWRGLCCSR
eukprot:COSAG02_NODE_6980_length_3250_cov_1.112663_3_plen_162_part_00